MADKEPIDFAEARQRLRSRRAELLERRRSQDRDRDELAETRSIEPSEAASADDLRDRLAQLGENERNQLLAIDAALSRIESGEYGECADCGDEIDPDRLRAIPEATRCVACAEHPVVEGYAAPDRSISERAGGHRIPAERIGVEDVGGDPRSD